MTLSHELGRIGLLERENATLLNAALVGLARRTTQAFTEALRASGLAAPLYLTQNDGTVMLAATAEAFPVYSFASGPTNSMRGAAFLSGLSDAIVIDVGGTTTDIGSLRHGFPREANNVVEVGGVRTLFRMPDLLSIGLGGGSLVADDGHRVGPRSVGYRLVEEGRVFGGEHADRHRRRGRRRPDRARRPPAGGRPPRAVSSRRRWRACTRASRRASIG